MAETEPVFLAQLRPANTDAQSLFSPEAAVDGRKGEQVVLKKIYIANSSNANVKYRLFFDNDGDTYDETTALCWDIQLGSGVAEVFDLEIAMRNSDGNLGVRTDKANDITFTLFGEK